MSRVEGNVSRGFFYLAHDLRTAYTNPSVFKWSLWWALATCGSYQLSYYSQIMWEEIIAVSGQSLYNGALEAVYTIIGALCALALSSLTLNWKLLGPLALASCALVQAATIYVIAITNDLWVAYACYITCQAAYQALVTIAR